MHFFGQWDSYIKLLCYTKIFVLAVCLQKWNCLHFSLKAEWMYSQSKGRQFLVGQHDELLEFLLSVCPLHPGEDWEEDKKLNLILSKVQEHQQSLREPGSGSKLIFFLNFQFSHDIQFQIWSFWHVKFEFWKSWCWRQNKQIFWLPLQWFHEKKVRNLRMQCAKTQFHAKKTKIMPNQTCLVFLLTIVFIVCGCCCRTRTSHFVETLFLKKLKEDLFIWKSCQNRLGAKQTSKLSSLKTKCK